MRMDLESLTELHTLLCQAIECHGVDHHGIDRARFFAASQAVRGLVAERPQLDADMAEPAQELLEKMYAEMEEVYSRGF